MPPTAPLFSLGDALGHLALSSPCNAHDRASCRPQTGSPSNATLSTSRRRLLLLSNVIHPAVAHPHPIPPTQKQPTEITPKISSASSFTAPGTHDIPTPTPTKSNPPVTAEHASFIPNPTPGSGPVSAHPDAQGYGYPLANPAPALLTRKTSRVPQTSRPTSSPVATAPSTFYGLPPLLSRGSSTSSNADPSEVITSPISTRKPQPTENGPQISPGVLAAQAPRLDNLVIVFIAVGVFLLFLGIGIVVRITLQRRRKARPTPSLPILRDGENFSSENDKTDESPLFGGKERFSPLPATGPNWAWVQYTRPAQLASQSLGDVGAPSQGDEILYGSASSTRLASQPQPSQNDPSNQPPPVPRRQSYLQIPPKAVASSRLSTTTASFYSPQTAYANIGIAISTLPDETAGASLPNDQSKAKQKSLQPVTIRRESLTSCSELPYDDKESSDDTSGDTEPLASVAHSAPHIPEGRPRVHSGYFPAGAFPPLASTASAPFSIATATKVKVPQRNSLGKGLPLQRSNSKRLRETQALTYALGLATPRPDNTATSPHETLYPDDSMSVADARPSAKAPGEIQKAAVHQMHEGPSSSRDGFRSQGVLHKSAAEDCEVTTSRGGTTESRSAQSFESEVRVARLAVRNADRPPRVPSPPPLPSLAQMALAHNNPEGYENYRSPTYSIYGLYEPKSGR